MSKEKNDSAAKCGWAILPCDGCNRITPGRYPRAIKEGVKTPAELCFECPRLKDAKLERVVVKRG